MATPWLKLTKMPKCKPGCIHAGKVENLPMCNYIFNTGHRRPCPAGKECTEYKRGKPLRKPGMWDDY